MILAFWCYRHLVMFLCTLIESYVLSSVLSTHSVLTISLWMCAIIIALYRWKNWSMEKLSNLFEVIELVIELTFELKILVSEVVCLIILVYSCFCDAVGFWFVFYFRLHHFTSFWLYIHDIKEVFIYFHFLLGFVSFLSCLLSMY